MSNRKNGFFALSALVALASTLHARPRTPEVTKRVISREAVNTTTNQLESWLASQLKSIDSYIRLLEYANMMKSMLREYKASIFQALGHPTRIAILEVLRDGELSARAIQTHLGVEQANLSQHLAVLRSREIVSHRKEGNQVFYSLRNKVLGKVLDLMREYFEAHLNEAVTMLTEVRGERSLPARRSASK